MPWQHRHQGSSKKVLVCEWKKWLHHRKCWQAASWQWEMWQLTTMQVTWYWWVCLCVCVCVSYRLQGGIGQCTVWGVGGSDRPTLFPPLLLLLPRMRRDGWNKDGWPCRRRLASQLWRRGADETRPWADLIKDAAAASTPASNETGCVTVEAINTLSLYSWSGGRRALSAAREAGCELVIGGWERKQPSSGGSWSPALATPPLGVFECKRVLLTFNAGCKTGQSVLWIFRQKFHWFWFWSFLEMFGLVFFLVILVIIFFFGPPPLFEWCLSRVVITVYVHTMTTETR